MPERVSKVEHEYAGRRLKVGERFDCEPQHVAMMLAIGRVEPEEGEPGYVGRDLQAGGPTNYMTRDLQAAPPRRRGRPPKAGTQ